LVKFIVNARKIPEMGQWKTLQDGLGRILIACPVSDSEVNGECCGVGQARGELAACVETKHPGLAVFGV
jgi:hypothetical protein